MSQLVIFRHGQSVWNLENKFTGWVDVSLTEKGIKEAEAIGEKLKPFRFAAGYASGLKRTQESLLIALRVSGQSGIPVIFSAALNERNYGDLQGLNKTEAIRKYGAAQVDIWRRSYAVAPPNGESLKDTFDRAVPYLENVILPELRAKGDIVMATHGNTMRALIMHLERCPPEAIERMEFETGEMRVYELA